MSGNGASNELGLMAKAPGGKLLSTMAELRHEIEQKVMASPQRLTLARAYLDSLAWGIQGLETMGQKIGFQLLAAPPPEEYPQMLYRRREFRIASTAVEAQRLISEGFSPRVPGPWPLAEQPETQTPLPAPTFSVRIPSGGPPVNPEDPDDEV